MEIYTSQLRIFLNEMKGKPGPFRLDMSDELQRSLAIEMYGGYYKLREMSPRLHSMLCAENPPKTNGDLQDSKVFSDGALIRQALYNPEDQSIFTSGRITLAGKPKQMHVVVTFLSKEGQMLGRRGFFTRNSGFQSISYTREGMQTYPEGATAVYHISHIPENSEEPLFTILAQEISQNDVIDSLVVTDPMKKATHSFDEIRVVYARKPADREKVDYNYPEKREPITRNQYFFLEMTGEVKLKGNYTIDEIDKTESGAIMSFEDLGDIFYNNDFMAGIEVNKAKNGFLWSFKKKEEPTTSAEDKADWMHAIPMSQASSSRLYFFDLYIKFRVLDGDGKKVMKPFHINVTSDTWTSHKEDNGYYAIPLLHLFWGCLGENTLVKMADGSQRKISAVQIGDLVKTPESASRVTNIFTGREPKIYCVKAEGQDEILCTETHPFMTGSGMKVAKDLLETDVLITQYGSAPLQYRFEMEYSGQIFNLQLDKSHTFYGNNYLVGDFEEQNRHRGPEDALPMPETEEMEALRNYFENL